MISEKCGLVAICGDYDLAIGEKTYTALCALQHRGQESAGIAIIHQKSRLYKGKGLVKYIFKSNSSFLCEGGYISLGHVCSRHDDDIDTETQPIELDSPIGKILIAINGSIRNYGELFTFIHSDIHQNKRYYSDAELVGYLFVEALKTNSAASALRMLQNELKGSFCIIVASHKQIYCIRDRFGFRPLCYGRTSLGQFVFASETCALTAIGANVEREVQPGEIVTCNKLDVSFDSYYCDRVPSSFCSFEYFYLANRVSVINGKSVAAIRYDAGRLLAMKEPVSCDLVIGVPATGIDFAKGFAAQLGLQYSEGIKKNEEIYRTFIVPNQEKREELVRKKFVIIPEVVKDKSIFVVDDSIVRGTTAIQIAKLLRIAGAKKVHYRVCSPRLYFKCPYGTDIGGGDELIANNKTIRDIAQIIGVDSLSFLSNEDIEPLMGCELSMNMCKACFDGNYPDR